VGDLGVKLLDLLGLDKKLLDALHAGREGIDVHTHSLQVHKQQET
jgi:hypothetical protein